MRRLLIILLLLPVLAAPGAALADWERLPGQAFDIAVAGGRDAWCLGGDADGGGRVWRWDGRDWRDMNGAGVRIAVEPGGAAWVVNDRGEIWRWANGWGRTPGQAVDIACGGGQVWAVGAGRGVWRWTGGGWERYPGAGVRIAVDDSGMPWVVNERGGIYRWDGRDWQKAPGQAVDIACGGGTVWVLGRRPVPGGFGVYRWNGGDWEGFGGGGVSIAVDGRGRPWLCNDRGDIFRWR